MKLKKGVYVFVILFILTITPFIIAEQHEPALTEVDKAYACLEDKLADNCAGTKSTKQASFNLLAASYSSSLQSDCKSTLNGLKKNNCWGETDTGTCNIKSTALATLALKQIEENVDDQVSYLLDKKISGTGLTWYLEIDSNNRTDCTINGQTITIEENKKISGSLSAGSGLKKAYNDYWFEITNTEQNYTISCNKDFITALIYQKPGSSTGSNIFHISSETQSASEFDSVTERVDSYCLSTSNVCDYEGTLWAAIALAKAGESVDPLIPYLTSMADEADNINLLPSAFLYILTAQDDYYSELISLQNTNSYWHKNKNTKFYDTALALLALQNINSNEVERSKRYLLSIQKDDGCWQSDTAFILHAAWPKNPAISTGTGVSYCEDFNNYCVSIGNCDLTNKLDNFYCPSSAEVCCSVQVQEPTCSEKQGTICDLNQECSVGLVIASDTPSCCTGDCTAISTTNECENAGFFCRPSCSDSQEEKAGYSNSCSFGDVCCATKPAKSSSLLLIISLIILIILVILAIIFRNQLKVWIFKRKSGYKAKKESGGPGRPGAPGPLLQMPGQFRPPRRPMPGRRPAPASHPKDRDFEETMKKLRDMGK